MRKVFNLLKITFVVGVFMLMACSKSDPTPVKPYVDPDVPPMPAPELTGKLAFIAQSAFGSYDTQLLLFDFNSMKLSSLVGEADAILPSAPAFSADGRYLVFEGRPKQGGNPDLYLIDFEASLLPVNLTNSSSRDEKPSFSPDAKSIIYTRNGKITIQSLVGLATVELDCGFIEAHSPVFTPDAQSVLFYAVEMEGASTHDLYRLDIETLAYKKVVSRAFIDDFAAKPLSDSSFYFTGSFSTLDPRLQLFKGYTDLFVYERLPLNAYLANYRDLSVVDAEYVLFSSDRNGGKGGYDLYIGQVKTGDVWNLNDYFPKLNNAVDELSPVYVNP